MIMGLDLSLRGPALCCLPIDWIPGDWESLGSYQRLHTEEMRGHERVDFIVDVIESMVIAESVRYVFIEEYAFSYNTSSVTMLAELGGAVKRMLRKNHKIIPVSVVASSARKLLFGTIHRMKKAELKEYIMAQMVKMGAPFGDNHDLCDAFVVANFGLSHFGRPCLMQESEPKKRR